MDEKFFTYFVNNLKRPKWNEKYFDYCNNLEKHLFKMSIDQLWENKDLVFEMLMANNYNRIVLDLEEAFYTLPFNEELIENIYDNVDVFWNMKQGQVEILDPSGELLMDSYGIRDSEILSTPDISKAKNGEVGVWIGKVDRYHDKVMIVSKAITSKINPSDMIGIVRIIFSLEEVHKIIDIFSVLFLFISIIVIALGIIMSLIIDHIKEMDVLVPSVSVYVECEKKNV